MKMMNKNVNGLLLVSLVVFVCLSSASYALADWTTFNACQSNIQLNSLTCNGSSTLGWNQIYNHAYSGVPGFHQNGQDGSFHADSTTANKVCLMLGYAGADSYGTSNYSSCGDNYYIKWEGSVTPPAPTPVCTANSYKQCSGTAVYWYDSCATRTSIFAQCASNQVCLNAQCVNITCSSNSDCTDGNINTVDTCLNPGTIQSSCTHNTIVCSSNSDCADGNANTVDTCLNPGTIQSSCTHSSVACATNADCGTDGYTGSPFCRSGDAYQNYTTYTCSGAGTTTSRCVVNTASKLKDDCSGNETCSGGSCSGNTCGSHSYQKCSGNYLYWYDSCGTRQDSQYCPNGCNGNTCQNYNYNNVTVQTNAATNVYNNQATLNGYLYNDGSYNNSYNYNNGCSTYVWFQYGPTSSYGSETSHMSQNYSGTFSQTVNMYGGLYHFRAVAQSCSGSTVYGQDTTTYGSQTSNSNLTVTKTVKNITSGSGFATTTNANPSDVLLFMITLQANGQDAQNVVVRDSLPANLIYNNQVIVACTTNNGSNNYNCNGNNYNYSGNILSGVNLNTIYAGQTVTITYQTQVASITNFSYGSTTLNNNVSVTSSNGSNPSATASVFVTRSAVYGASTVSTGLTNNFWADSFFLPLLITLIGIWMWKSGAFFGIEKWLDSKKKNRNGYKSEKELQNRIAMIQKTEKA